MERRACFSISWLVLYSGSGWDTVPNMGPAAGLWKRGVVWWSQRAQRWPSYHCYWNLWSRYSGKTFSLWASWNLRPDKCAYLQPMPNTDPCHLQLIVIYIKCCHASVELFCVMLIYIHFWGKNSYFADCPYLLLAITPLILDDPFG